MLQLQVTSWISVLLLVDALVNLCDLLALIPDLVDQLLKLELTGNFDKWVANVLQVGVVIELPVLVFVFDAPLDDALVLERCGAHQAIPGDLDASDHTCMA